LIKFSIQPDMWPLDANSRRPGGKISLKLPQTLKQPLTDSGYHLLRNLTRRLRSQRRSHTSLSSYLAASPLRYDSERSLAFPPKQAKVPHIPFLLHYLFNQTYRHWTLTADIQAHRSNLNSHRP